MVCEIYLNQAVINLKVTWSKEARLNRRKIYLNCKKEKLLFLYFILLYFNGFISMNALELFMFLESFFSLLFSKNQKTDSKIDSLTMPVPVLSSCLTFRKVSPSWKGLQQLNLGEGKVSQAPVWPLPWQGPPRLSSCFL